MRRALIALASLLASCEAQPRSLEWRFVAISEDADRIARIDVIQARVLSGGCTGEEVFATDLVVGEGAQAAMAPPVLGPGTYGVSGDAYGADCIYLFRGCTEVVLPQGGTLEVELQESTADPACEPGDPGAADVTFDVGSRDPPRAISPWIYGMNDPDVDGAGQLATVHSVINSRWSTHNWETGASNAGAWFGWGNDFMLAEGANGPAAAVDLMLTRARASNAAVVIPLSLMARVAADGDGTVVNPDTEYATRFIESRFARTSGFEAPPDTSDGVVYQDELVNYIEHGPLMRCADCERDVVWSLDFEPDNWEYAFDRLPEGESFSETELLDRSIALARAIKAVDPDAIVIGPWVSGFRSLSRFRPPSFPTDGQLAFVRNYLEAVYQELPTSVVPVVDAFATTYKSELDAPISENDTTDQPTVALRLQAARSLWDDTYVEGSWATDWLGGEPIMLIPRLREILTDRKIGMRIAIPRWTFGGGVHISGAIAAAEAFGAFGREDLLLACGDSTRDRPFLAGAYAAYRNYDGTGGTFGDLSVRAETSDREGTSIWASTFDGAPERGVLVATNRTDQAIEVAVRITHRRRFRAADIYQVTSENATPLHTDTMQLELYNAFRIALPAMSVTTIALH